MQILTKLKQKLKFEKYYPNIYATINKPKANNFFNKHNLLQSKQPKIKKELQNLLKRKSSKQFNNINFNSF